MTKTIGRRQVLGAALAGGLVMGAGRPSSAAARGVSGSVGKDAGAGASPRSRQPMPGEADDATRAVLLRHAGELGGYKVCGSGRTP